MTNPDPQHLRRASLYMIPGLIGPAETGSIKSIAGSRLYVKFRMLDESGKWEERDIPAYVAAWIAVSLSPEAKEAISFTQE